MLPILPLRFELQQQQSLRLPYHAGSMLRGAFGMALKKLACITKQKDCKTCPLYRSCPYTQIFETPVPVNAENQQAVNPYIIQAPTMGERIIYSGETWSFGMTLVGKAIDQLPLIAYAWQKACEGGFSSAQSQANLLGIYQGENCIYQANGSLSHYSSTSIATPALTNQTRLHFVTPLRLQANNHIMLCAEQITASHLLITLAKRVQRMMELHTHQPLTLDFPALLTQAKEIRLSTQLQRATVPRYSNRQQQAMNLEGLMGTVTLHGELGHFAPLLQLGEYIHVGKSATFGLGRYSILTGE